MRKLNIYYNTKLVKDYLSHNKDKTTADNKKAKIERKEDANTKTTRDMLSKRKPKPSA